MSRLARLPAIMAVMATLLWAVTVQATEVYIPHLTGGEADWVDYLQVDNLGLGAASYTVNLYRRRRQGGHGKRLGARAVAQDREPPGPGR